MFEVCVVGHILINNNIMVGLGIIYSWYAICTMHLLVFNSVSCY